MTGWRRVLETRASSVPVLSELYSLVSRPSPIPLVLTPHSSPRHVVPPSPTSPLVEETYLPSSDVLSLTIEVPVGRLIVLGGPCLYVYCVFYVFVVSSVPGSKNRESHSPIYGSRRPLPALSAVGSTRLRRE